MINVVCPYCKTFTNPIITEPLIPTECINHSKAFQIYECIHCRKPFRVDFDIIYTPYKVSSYKHTKCDCCGKTLYIGLDSINIPTDKEEDSLVFKKYKTLCDKCYWECKANNESK